MKRPINIFYVYADADEGLRQQLETHLALLKRQQVIAGWQQSLAGDPWAEKAEEALNEAALILLLISPDFLASDVCYEQQMQRALERQKRGEVQVIPILLRPADGKDAPFAHLQALPTNGKPITSWANQDEAFVHVIEGIRRVLEGRPLSVVQERKQEAGYATENQQAVYRQPIGEHNTVNNHFYPPISPPPMPKSGPNRPESNTNSRAKPTNIRVLSRPSREGNKGVILFVLDGIEHTLEYMRYDRIFGQQILFLKENQQELVRLPVPFATFKSVEKQATFQVGGVDGLFTFKMSAITSIMNINIEVGGVEVFHN